MNAKLKSVLNKRLEIGGMREAIQRFRKLMNALFLAVVIIIFSAAGLMYFGVISRETAQNIVWPPVLFLCLIILFLSAICRFQKKRLQPPL